MPLISGAAKEVPDHSAQPVYAPLPTPPAASGGNAILTEFKIVLDVVASTVVPASLSCMKGDVNGDGVVDGGDIALFASILVNGGGTLAQTCAGDVQTTPDGAVGAADVDAFVNCLLNGGCS